MQPLRIHFFVNFVHTQGTYFRFHNLAIGLVRLGQKVVVYAGDHDNRSSPREEVRDGVVYRIVPESKGLSYLPINNHPLTTLRRTVARYPRCDIAHLFQPFAGAAGAWLRCRAKAHFFDWDDLWKGGLMSERPQERGLKKPGEIYSRFILETLERKLPRKADHVTTCSHFLADLATQRQARKATVLVNGFWPFEPPAKRIARKNLGLHSDALYVGFMGRTVLELPWCFDALESCLGSFAQLRFALCGADLTALKGIPTPVVDRIDNLGQLTPLQTRDFAAALDLGLLPLEDNAFNRSRFPIKFAEYMAAGTPVLCSQVGECAFLSQQMNWVVKAGTNREQWLHNFRQAVDMLDKRKVPPVDVKQVETTFSWDYLSAQLLSTYRAELNRGQDATK